VTEVKLVMLVMVVQLALLDPLVIPEV